MPREELEVPGIPHFRVSAEVALDSPPLIPSPHIDLRTKSESESASFTIATRSLTVPNQATVPNNPTHGSPFTAPIVQPVSPVPETDIPAVATEPPNKRAHADVRFVANAFVLNPTLEEMAREAFPPGQSPLSVLPSENANEAKANDYPYWVVALVQIAIGTLLVILVVKFANIVRESTDFTPRQVLVPARPDSRFASESSRVSLLGNSKTSGNATPLRPYGF